jgi:hypothetical protein
MWIKWLSIFLLTTPVWAYRFTTDFTNGFYWQELPINITVVDSDSARNAKITALAQAAIVDWQKDSDLKLWSYSGSGSKNIIRWSTNFAQETKMDPTTVLAVAIRYTDGPYFAKTEIVINGSHTFNQNDALLRTTLTHELGHTMGLDHSEVSQAVMAPTLQTFYTGLHSDDIAGILAAHAEMDNRQVTRYISPLAYNKESADSNPVSCGSIGPVASVNSGVSVNGLVSLLSGLLISFVRKIIKWFKSRC